MSNSTLLEELTNLVKELDKAKETDNYDEFNKKYDEMNKQGKIRKQIKFPEDEE